MIYKELLSKIDENCNFSIKRKICSDNFFGDFLIELLYKNKITVRIINDRGIIKIFITAFCCEVPFEFAVEYVNRVKHKNCTYNFRQLECAYDFLKENVAVLDTIIEEKTMCKIILKWVLNSHIKTKR